MNIIWEAYQLINYANMLINVKQGLKKSMKSYDIPNNTINKILIYTLFLFRKIRFKTVFWNFSNFPNLFL